MEMRARIELFEQSHAEEALKIEKLEYRKALVRKRLLELKKYQNRWVGEKRDQKILDRGKEELETWGNDNRKCAQKLVAPEVTRIASAMSCNKELSLDGKLLFVQDLQTHCGRDFAVVYLPTKVRFKGFVPRRVAKPTLQGELEPIGP
ncbi:hypothetical protein IFM51744_09732 [Aspergillus udagawae]|nr:hypothetical protein IFM51744_09732 [Aspergillus udagawae]GFG11609.1 hypothetical protein IFM5058_05525 [Aspergillus udagawae]